MHLNVPFRGRMGKLTNINPAFLFCKLAVEDVQYIFWACPIVRIVWKMVEGAIRGAGLMGKFTNKGAWKEGLLRETKGIPSSLAVCWRFNSCAVAFTIWCTCNSVVFY